VEAVSVEAVDFSTEALAAALQGQVCPHLVPQ
jgi:hypothetical protein